MVCCGLTRVNTDPAAMPVHINVFHRESPRSLPCIVKWRKEVGNEVNVHVMCTFTVFALMYKQIKK